MADQTPGTSVPLGVSLRSAVSFAWEELPIVVLVSVCWLLASLPLVTVGLATLGAYATVLAKRAAYRGEIPDTRQAVVRAVLKTLRRGAVPATILGTVPLMFASITVIYAVEYLRTGSVIFGALALGAFIVGSQVCLIVIPGLLYLATGRESTPAIRAGYTWSISNPRRSVGTGVLTALLGAMLLPLTVAFPLLFGGIAATFHAEVVLPGWRQTKDQKDEPRADLEWGSERPPEG